MTRFNSLGRVPTETRQVLRERFRRFLPKGFRAERTREPTTVSDEAVLTLLLDLDIRFESDAVACRERYESNRLQHAGAPPFEDLVPLGLFRLVWGRMEARIGVGRLLDGTSEELRAALAPILESRHKRTFAVGSGARAEPSLAPIIAALTDNPDGVHHLACASPAWVAARLWERAPHSDPHARLRFCVDRWALLQGYSFAPTREWDESRVRDFREASFQVLQSAGAFFGWTDLRKRLLAQMSLGSKQPISAMESHVAAVPAALVDRLIWIDRQEFGRARDEYETCEDLWILVNLLLGDAAAEERTTAPHPVVRTLIDAGIERPELLSFLVNKASQEPALLADLLLDARLTATVCVVIAEWQSSGGAWDRDLVSRDDRSARGIAYADAVSVLSHYLADGTLPPSEAAALLSWMHEHTGRPSPPTQERIVGQAELEVVRSELTGQSTSTLMALCAALAPSIRVGLGSSAFAASIDVVATGSLVDQVQPEPFVAAYVESLRAGEYALAQIRLERSRARVLVELGLRCGEAAKRRFLFPLDVPALLAEGDKPGANSFIINDRVVRSIRAHVRVLSRAIALWEDAVPSELVDAIVAAVQAGAFQSADRERVAAFSPRHDAAAFFPSDDGPIATDLAAALSALEDAPRDTLLGALLETTEPMILAQLATSAPYSVRERIQQRIAALAPSADDLSNLTEIQARIAALLSSGSLDAAAGLIEIERAVDTYGPVPGRALARLRAEMQLLLLKGDFDAVARVTPREQLPPGEHTEELEALDFYKALAQFLKKDGDRDFARRIFEQLHKRHSDIAAYAVNLFAVRTSAILAGDLFGRVHGERAREARTLLREDVLHSGTFRNISDDDRAIHGCNQALLFLATGQPDRAKDLLDAIPGSQMGDRVAAYTAVALSRLGRHAESRHALNDAVAVFGKTEALKAASAQTRKGDPYDARATTSNAEDYSQGIRDALVRLSNMDPLRQASLFHGPPDAFGDFVIPRVRAVAANVMSLVPMMKRLGLDTHEDHVTALIQAILRPRFDLVGWTVVDQPLGGHTAKGNPGRRDLVVKKDAFDLAVIEAVFCRDPITWERTRANVVSHFQRLLAYSSCQLFFHVTYLAIADGPGVISELKRAAQSEVPEGFSYLRMDDIQVVDSGPDGFIARYKSSRREVKVVFLIVDLLQELQKNAARAASVTIDGTASGA